MAMKVNYPFNSLLLFFILSCFLVGCSKNYFSCDYYKQGKNSSNEIFKILNGDKPKSSELDSLIKVLTSLSFPYKGFEVVYDNSGNVDVAKAVIDFHKGYRYIVLNSDKFKNINLNNPNKSASALGVLAHELAHLTYSHIKSSHKNELLADEFAGWLLRKLGIAREYCTQSLDDFIPQNKEEKTSTHPSKIDRRNAMYLGWDRANIDTKVVYSVCCDTSSFSSFTVEGIFFQKDVNDGNPSFVDFTISTYNEKGELVQEFDKQIINHLKIRPSDNTPIVLFKNLKFVLKDKRIYKIKFSICECAEPCDGKIDARECPGFGEVLVKDIQETIEIPFADYGFMKIRFKK